MQFNLKASHTYLPDNFRVNSSMLDLKLGLPAGSVEARSGIKSRYIFPLDFTQSKAMSECILAMCAEKNMALSDIDLVVCANAVPEQTLPNTSSAVIRHLGLEIAAMDINISCLSFIAALQMSVVFLHTQQYKNIVVVSCDMPHKCLNYQDGESSYIFGDGCTSFLLSSEGVPNAEFKGANIQTYPECRDYCQIKIGGSLHNVTTGYLPSDFYFKMEGKKLFKAIAQKIDGFMDNLMTKINFNKSQLAYVVPHQASHLGMSHVVKKLGFTPEQVINIYPEHGNQVGASMPTALHSLLVKKQIGTIGKVLVMGTGAGLTIGGALLEL